MTAEHELVLTRLIDAPRENLYRCWTEPALLKQWFAARALYHPGGRGGFASRRREPHRDAGARRHGNPLPRHLS